ncbi:MULTISPECIES: DEAD/DEAH box helicase [unclassified Paenibacillus]|uniref:DEAD/DEAH box helicase n=1 Tax=unclassified Paenibacillus TaxID=185978 RepID=UPI002379E5F5|nr:helicase-related protein [Paenibacillus sp. MAHUQ-63]
MKVQLYAVCIRKEWRWHLSIHSMTDIQYWFEQYAADAGLVMFEPFVSFGQGIRMLAKLNSASGAAIEDEAMLEQIRQAANSCKFALTGELRTKRISYEMWKCGAFTIQSLESSLYAKLVEACRGKALLMEEFEQLTDAVGLGGGMGEPRSYLQLAHLHGDITLTNGLVVMESRDWRRALRRRTSYRCKRCGSGEERMFWSLCQQCGQSCPYCEACLSMGRSRFCSILIQGHTDQVVGTGIEKPYKQDEAENAEDLQCYIRPWGLSEAQARASEEGLRYISREGSRGRGERADRNPAKFLIWAVTGAGKTEMIFPFVQYIVTKGGRVLLTTPRKDVVLELQPRITRAFMDNSVVTLYGGSEQRWEQGQITIATTHQLLRFHEAFDLVIIDEIDAFPYHNNPMLAYAAAKVCKPSGVNILLSATPPTIVRKEAERGHLPHVRVPVRYHRHPLPVPELIVIPALTKVIQSGNIPGAIFEKLKVSLERNAQVFVFVPNIQLVEPMVAILRSVFSVGGSIVRVEGTSSKDANRTDKVQKFRSREIRMLVTTTILERGVTIPQSDVFILDADSKLFDDAALVQMAGRAGRSKDDPAGKVYFAAKEITHSQKEAVRQVKKMNRIASKQGYFERGK